MNKKKESDISEIVIMVTVRKTNFLNQYAGNIIAKSNGYKKVKLNYIWENPLIYKEKLDFKIIDGNQEIKIDNSFYTERPNFGEKYKYIFLWAHNIILDAVEIYSNNKDAGIPNPPKSSFQINKIGLNLIFVEKNQ
jgi:hypothetical protein